MPPPRRAHDRKLLDALEAQTPEAFAGTTWRVVRAARDPLQGYPAGGRWDPPGAFEVIYTSLEADGALAEVHFHLSRAPVFPSKTLYRLHEIRVATKRTLRLANLRLLAGLGVDQSAYASFDYTTTQAIGAPTFWSSTGCSCRARASPASNSCCSWTGSPPLPGSGSRARPT